MCKIKNARVRRANSDLLFFCCCCFFFSMIKYANLRRSCRLFFGVIEAPNWFITTLRELINSKKLLIGLVMYPRVFKTNRIKKL